MEEMLTSAPPTLLMVMDAIPDENGAMPLRFIGA